MRHPLQTYQMSPFMLDRKSSYALAAFTSAATVGGAAPASPPTAAAAAAAREAASKPCPPLPASSWTLDDAANTAALEVMGLGRGAGCRWMRTAAGMNDGRATFGSERGGSGFETGSALTCGFGGFGGCGSCGGCGGCGSCGGGCWMWGGGAPGGGSGGLMPACIANAGGAIGAAPGGW